MVATLVVAVIELKRLAAVDATPSVLHMLAETQALLQAELESRGAVLAGLAA